MSSCCLDIGGAVPIQVIYCAPLCWAKDLVKLVVGVDDDEVDGERLVIFGWQRFVEVTLLWRGVSHVLRGELRVVRSADPVVLRP